MASNRLLDKYGKPCRVCGIRLLPGRACTRDKTRDPRMFVATVVLMKRLNNVK